MDLRSFITSAIISTVILFAIIMEVAISSKHEPQVVSKKATSHRSISYKSKMKKSKLLAEAKMQRRIAKN